MVAAASSSPQRRAGDTSRRVRWRAWWSLNGVQFVVFALLAVIVAGEASDFINDREQADRDQHQECVLGNAVEQSSESLRRLREQAPTIQAARQIIAAETPAERLAAAEALRRVGVPEFKGPLAEPEDCEP